MAINVKSVSRILGEMIRELDAKTPLTDVSEGSVVGTILEAAALQDFQNQLSVLKVLESSNLQSLIGTDLDNKAIEMTLPNGIGGFGRIPAREATGVVTISSPFKKISSALYIGKPAPFAGSFNVFIQTAEGFPPTGSIYIGRGTLNEEGPIPYSQVIDNGTFATLILSNSSPLVKNHNYSEPVVLSQGGNRNISAGTIVRSPAAPGVRPVDFLVNDSAVIIDGEPSIDVAVTCSIFGEEGNVAAGSIKLFITPPFQDAEVINKLPLANGAAPENDESLRTRIKNYVATLSRGTRIAINSSLINLKDPQTGKTITSLNIVEPADISEPAKIYIDDGTGLEPTIFGQDYELLLNNASGQEVLFRTANYPITPSTVLGSRPGPYVLRDGMVLEVQLDGIIERYRINSSEYVNLNSVVISEIVRSFNSQATLSGVQNIGFRSAGGGQLLSVFDLVGDAEIIRVLPGELQLLLGLPTDEIRPLFLYRSNELLSFKGKTATVVSSPFPFNALSSVDLENVGIKVDGVTQWFTINNTDFAQFGATIATATIDQWATVFRSKVAGLDVYAGGGRLFFTTWQKNSSNGSIEILSVKQNGSSASWIGVNKLFNSGQVLSDVGRAADYEINRVTGQVKLLQRPPVGSNITIASQNTKAEILSKTSPTGFFSTGPTTFGNSKVVVAADGDFALRLVPSTGVIGLEPVDLSPNQNLVRLYATETTLFVNAQINDYLYINPDSSAPNFMTNRLNSFFRVRRKGANSTGVDISSPNNGLDFTSSGVNTIITVNTSVAHGAVAGAQITLSGGGATPTAPGLQALINASHFVESVVSPTQLTIVVPYDLGVNTYPTGYLVNYTIDRNAFVDVEVSKLQKEAFFGLFNDSPVSYSVGLGDIIVTIPDHSLSGGSIVINGGSASFLEAFPLSYPVTRTITSIVDKDRVVVNMLTPAVSPTSPVPVTLDGQYTTIFSSFDVTPGMFHLFKCEKSFPQVIDFGSLPSLNADQLVSVLNDAVGIEAYKESPRRVALRSNSYDVNTASVAVLAVIGAANAAFDPKISEGIQAHVASKVSQSINAGGIKVVDRVLPTAPNLGYPNRGALNFTTTETEIVDTFTNPSAQSSVNIIEYPKGLQELGISGREYNHIKRVYNNNNFAPFNGFVRGDNVVPPVAQSVSGTNLDESSLGIRLNDLPISFTDTLVVEMDLDPVNKTTAVPLFKRCLIENMQTFGAGSGSQITFTLKDPDDETTPNVFRPFFDVNSVYRNFDFTDFNLLFKPTIVLTNYQNISTIGNPPDAFIIESTQFGMNHELRFSTFLPNSPNVSDIVVSHKNFEESGRTVLHVFASLCSLPTIIGSDYTGVYTITPSDLTGPYGAEIVQLQISALSINLSNLYQVGNILNIGGNLPYSGSYLIIGTPDSDNIIVASPGVRAASYNPVSYDGGLAPVTTFPLQPKSMQDVIDAVNAYYASNPIVSIKATTGSNTTLPVIYPTFYTHGNLTENEGLINNTQSYDYHAKRAPYGTMLHIHTYNPVAGEIVALNQSSESALPVFIQIDNTGFPVTYENIECVIVPSNAKTLRDWLNFTAISPLSIQSNINRVQNEDKIQINSFNLGSASAVRITGVSGNAQTVVTKTSPFKTGGILKLRTDFSPTQAFTRDSVVRIQNSIASQIFRAYRSAPGLPPASAVTEFNLNDITSWFRTDTRVAYSRPIPGRGLFTFRKSSSGVEGGDVVEISAINSFIKKIEITSGLGKLQARVGDMLILRGDRTNYISQFAPENQCISPGSGGIVDQYIGYPVVHVASDKEVHVIAPNMVPETVTMRAVQANANPSNQFSSNFNTDITLSADNGTFSDFSIGDVIEVSGFTNPLNNGRFVISNIDTVNSSFVRYTSSRTNNLADETSSSTVVVRQNPEIIFIPMFRAEKNVRSTYNAGAILADNSLLQIPNEEMFYRIKTIGNGFVYAEFKFNSHDDMYLDDMSVNTGDWIAFSNAFDPANRGRYKILAHNNKNAVVFFNPSAVDEVINSPSQLINGIIGSSLWLQGPLNNNTLPTIDKRLVRFYDYDSVFENDRIIIANPIAGTTEWFDSSLIGSWSVFRTGINAEFDPFVEAVIPPATSAPRTILLGNSRNSISFSEGAPLTTYKVVAGYTHSDANEIDADLFIYPQTEDYKISPAFNTQISVIGKLGFDVETTIGVDGYRYYGGLIAEAHRVIDGSPTNTITYPGVRAAGTSIEVQAPLTKNILLAMEITPRDGVSLNAIKNPVRSVVSSYIRTLGVGQEVILSEVVKQVQNVPGVKGVVIISTTPPASDGVIKMGSYEVPRIDRPEDILI